MTEQQGATVKRLFFGRAEKGELALGVLDIPEEGFAAGRFHRAGNAACAKFYRAKALREQVD